jgi:NAD+ diphosphatase
MSRRSHERIGGRRTDAAWLAEAWAEPATRVLVLADGRFPLLADGSAVAWCSPSDAPAGERLLLGEHEGVVHFAVLAPLHAVEGRPTGSWGSQPGWATLREAASRLGAADAGFLVQAQALAEWHRVHRFCPRCGAALEVRSGGYVLRCTGCERSHFPRTDPAVIMLVTDGNRALLGRQPSWPAGRYSTLAGFVDPGESLEDAVAREVMEEAGIAVTDVTYYGNQPWPFPASLMVGFFARATTTAIDVDGEEIEDARWFTREELEVESEAGRIGLPGRTSISRSLIEAWYGGRLTGGW